MNQVDVQVAVSGCDVPAPAQFAEWAGVAVDKRASDWEVCVRVVDCDESAHLNERYRGKTGATNVLSFVADIADESGVRLLGDVVICAPLVDAEARAQGKPVIAHWAHLTVHGVLHLLGMDHREPADAQLMEAAERAALTHLGYPDPYTVSV